LPLRFAKMARAVTPSNALRVSEDLTPSYGSATSFNANFSVIIAFGVIT
jgi:hypothetical protein